jgi:6-pyruvoyl-tetrahydropterin synthase related domain
MTTPPPTSSRQEGRPLPDWLLPLACCCLASVLILIPFFAWGAASGHDFEFHAASWFDAAYQWKEGILYPRWTAWTNHGFGEPRFIFYPPLSWMLGGLLTLLAPDPAVPMLYIVLTQMFAGLSAYLLLRRLSSRLGALLGAVFYTVNPDALLMVYIRSDFAEQLACALFPLLLLFALELCELLADSSVTTRTIAAFACLYAGVWLCNAPAGVIASYTMALLIAWAGFTHRSWRILARGGAALALGLGLASFYIVPAAYEQRWVNIGQALASGLSPLENFLFTAIPDAEHTWFNWIASICALSLILLFGLTALLSGRLTRSGVASSQNRPVFVALLVAGTAATALMLRWTLPLWNYLPKLRFVQFPWRWMSILALVCACFVFAVVERRRGWIWITLVLATTVPLAWFLVKNTWWDSDEMATMHDAVSSGTGFDGTDEYDPLGDDHLDLPSVAPLTKVLGAEDSDDSATPQARVQVLKWTTEKKEIRVESPQPARIALRLLNYPAWRIEVNGKAAQPERADDINQMIIPVPAGSSQIDVRFTRTTDRNIGNAISLLSALLTIGLFWIFPKTYPHGLAVARQRRSIEG